MRVGGREDSRELLWRWAKGEDHVVSCWEAATGGRNELAFTRRAFQAERGGFDEGM
jgi:hypothetical protein